MSDIGRNAPCPCGSGKKYKRCCLDRPAAPFTARDRQSALVKLMEFAMSDDLDEDLQVAAVEFWLGWLDVHADDEAGEAALALEESRDAFASWFALDFVLDDGDTVLGRMLRRRGGRLTRGEREYLGRMLDTHLRPYQVTDVRPGQGLRLIDLWTGRQVWVQERLGSEQLVRWDLLAVRLMAGADGHAVIDGPAYLYPLASKRALLRSLRRAHREFRRSAPVAGGADFFKLAGPLFHHFWLEWVALRPRPTLLTAEGDRWVFARAIFDVRDPEALAAALARHPDLVPEGEGGYTWTEPATDFRRGVGRFVLEGGRLVLETQSPQRVERGRRFLESLAGAAVRFRVAEYEDADRALDRIAAARSARAGGGAAPHRSAGAGSGGVATIPRQVEGDIVGAFYEQHYRRWLDEPIPALGGRTPREAARLRDGRPRLVALLQQFENLSARQRLAGQPAYDFGWMWAELGLKRPR